MKAKVKVDLNLLKGIKLSYTEELDDRLNQAWNNAISWGGKSFSSTKKIRRTIYDSIKDETSYKKIGDIVWNIFHRHWPNFYTEQNRIDIIGKAFLKVIR